MSDTLYFEYGEDQTAYLQTRDPLLGKAIAEVGHIRRPIIPDPFMALVKSIVGQQISTRAQITIWGRLCERFAPVTPSNIAAIPAEQLQACGISMRKAQYIKGVAESAADGRLNLAALPSMTDDEVCQHLCRLNGVGVWTAEMLMIFSMQRMDILSWSDLAIQRGLRMLYRHRKITRELFAKYRRRYSPYASVASLYLWAVSGGACTGLVDLAPKSAKTRQNL